MNNAIVKEYGGALFLLAAEEKIDEELLAETRAVKALLSENPDYVKLMLSPQIKLAERVEILGEAFEGRVHPYLLNFLKILAQNGYFAYAEECCDEFERLYDEAHRVEKATVYSAVELDDAQKAALALKLGKKRGKQIEINCEVDSSLIGGIRIELEGEIIDGSVKARIDNIRDNLRKTVV